MTDITVQHRATFALLSDSAMDKLRDAIRAELSDALYCNRVWDAWHYGTMSENDFVCLADDDSYVESMATSVIRALMETNNG